MITKLEAARILRFLSFTPYPVMRGTWKVDVHAHIISTGPTRTLAWSGAIDLVMKAAKPKKRT